MEFGKNASQQTMTKNPYLNEYLTQQLPLYGVHVIIKANKMADNVLAALLSCFRSFFLRSFSLFF